MALCSAFIHCFLQDWQHHVIHSSGLRIARSIVLPHSTVAPWLVAWTVLSGSERHQWCMLLAAQSPMWHSWVRLEKKYNGTIGEVSQCDNVCQRVSMRKSSWVGPWNIFTKLWHFGDFINSLWSVSWEIAVFHSLIHLSQILLQHLC